MKEATEEEDNKEEVTPKEDKKEEEASDGKENEQ